MHVYTADEYLFKEYTIKGTVELQQRRIQIVPATTYTYTQRASIFPKSALIKAHSKKISFSATTEKAHTRLKMYYIQVYTTGEYT